MALRRPLWCRRLALAPSAITDWGSPVSTRIRSIVLVSVLGMWLLVCLLSIQRGELPGAELLMIPIGAIVALGRRIGGSGDDKPDQGGDSE